MYTFYYIYFIITNIDISHLSQSAMVLSVYYMHGKTTNITLNLNKPRHYTVRQQFQLSVVKPTCPIRPHDKTAPQQCDHLRMTTCLIIGINFEMHSQTNVHHIAGTRRMRTRACSSTRACM